MKSSLKIWLILFVSVSSIYGTCSKDDVQANNNNNNNNAADNYKEPTLSATDTWVYMTSDLSLFYPNNYVGSNIRPENRKWIATNITSGSAFIYKNTIGDLTKGNFNFIFENKDKFTRFCGDTLNPNGKETMEINVKNFDLTPGPGSYTLDIDYKNGFCWYSVYKANGNHQDSTRHQAFDNSTFTVDKMDFVSSDAARDTYKMSGSANLWVMYFPTGTSSSTDIHKLQCYFNNAPVIFYK